ncbi:Uncharacterised protein [Vibrio cholerae]|nr:Uncharacterised protein [Vibrio cholerae]
MDWTKANRCGHINHWHCKITNSNRSYHMMM